MMGRVTRASELVLLAGLGLLFPTLALATDPASLRALISLRFPGLVWVTTEQLAGWLGSADEPAPILIDTRTPEEFAVSRIDGAARVSPDSERPAPEGALPERRIVVYCSVGYRSGAIARRLRKQGFEHVYNLEGGLFKWANEGRPIVDAGGEPARFVAEVSFATGKPKTRVLPARFGDGVAPAATTHHFLVPTGDAVEAFARGDLSPTGRISTGAWTTSRALPGALVGIDGTSPKVWVVRERAR